MSREKKKFPDQQRMLCTVILPKKDDRSDLRNYRFTYLLRLFYKLFMKITLSRISTSLDETQVVD